MKTGTMIKGAALALTSLAIASAFTACGGGGGDSAGGGGTVLYQPFETVYGDLCSTSTPTPGCTFDSKTGARITVDRDGDYNATGHGSDDLWYVQFDASGTGAVYNDLGQFQYYADVSSFAGYISGTTIGVGTTGFYWENIQNGTYWLGQNGVLYSANVGESRYGQAINTKTAGKASDTNFAALNSDANKALVAKASDKLMKDYGFQKSKATAIASALNSWAVAAAERGKTTEKDMDRTFKAVFGVNFADALSAVRDLQKGDVAGMQDLTNRSASALGLKPAQAQKFMKGMYRKSLASFGYDVDTLKW